jgi:hypothetical protein
MNDVEVRDFISDLLNLKRKVAEMANLGGAFIHGIVFAN